MAFKKITPKKVAPASPDILFRELPRRKIPDVLPHQQSMMQHYVAEAESKEDVALQLPTGSGKTLVGLLIGEWRRRKNGEKVVYLCPTKQLVHQVVSQAEQKYGLSVVGFTGSKQDYSTVDVTKYNQGDGVAITTYSSLFNTNPFFSDADVIIVDDAHAAENYVAKLWTISIDRFVDSHALLHGILSNLFRKHLDSVCFSRIVGQSISPFDLSWVDKLPTPALLQLHDELCEILDEYTTQIDLKYPWLLLRDNLRACHIYLTCSEITIRPIIAPTWTHGAFNDAKQRIYMSATLGEGGDLERLLGRKEIYRLPVPSGWDSQGVGRRFFMFPTLSLDKDESIHLRRSLMVTASRSLVLVPSEYMKKEISDDIAKHLQLTVYSASNIEKSKDNFVRSESSVAVVANRYDGIDFPGDECRLLLIEGLPKAVNAQERFLMSRMGANILFNGRIQTRIIQAIGRCTRSLEDYSAVVVTGDELPSYLADPRLRDYFHPELQAELWFGVEQSKDKSRVELEENFSLFIENGKDWEIANQTIVDKRNSSTQKSFPSIEQLHNAVKIEVEYQMALWQRDYIEALSKAESVIGILVDPALRGYRALWEYLAGSAALMATLEGNAALDSKARVHYSRAKSAAKGLPWLVRLSESIEEEVSGEPQSEEMDIFPMLQIEAIEGVLTSLGVIHDREYSKRERDILEGLEDETRFEEAHRLLGEHLGFDAGKVEDTASPDPWWQLGNLCLVFEDHANAEENSSLDATKARQVASHPAWMREHVPACQSSDVKVYPVLITPVSTIHPGAAPHLGEVYLWKLDEFKKWAQQAMDTIRMIRRDFIAGDLVWRINSIQTLQDNKIDIVSLVSKLHTQVAKDLLHEK